MRIHLEKDPEKLLRFAQNELEKLFKQNAEKQILFLTSGGSSLALLKNLDTDFIRDNTTVAVLDERADRDPETNNFAQVQNTEFYTRTKENGATFIDTKLRENETPEELAGRFESELKKWREKNPEGVIIATVGVGPDGHTSGILPHPENPELFEKLFNGNRWAVSYNAEGKNPYPLRVTVTIPFLKTIDFPITYMSGSNKADAYKRILSEKGNYAETPARILRIMKDVQIFTDIESET